MHRQMYKTQNNRQIESQLQREEEEKVGIDRCIQHITTDRQKDSYIERRRRRQASIDVYNIEQQIDREIVTKRGGGEGRHRQMYTTQINRQIERQLQREEEEKVDKNRCIQHRTRDRQRDSQIDREEEEVCTGRCIQHRTIDRQRDTYKERRRRRQAQIDVYNIEQEIDREIVTQRGGGGGRH